MPSARTFCFPNETYPLRELLGVFRGGRDTGDEAEPKFVLIKPVRTLDSAPNGKTGGKDE